MKRITLRMLVRLGACRSQLIVFERVFGDGCELTQANMVNAVRNHLCVSWLVFKLGSLNETKDLERRTAEVWSRGPEYEFLTDEYKAQRKQKFIDTAAIVLEAVNKLDLPQDPTPTATTTETNNG